MCYGIFDCVKGLVIANVNAITKRFSDIQIKTSLSKKRHIAIDMLVTAQMQPVNANKPDIHFKGNALQRDFDYIIV